MSSLNILNQQGVDTGAPALIEAGADVLVAGSAIFHAPNPLAEINALKAL